MECVSGFHSCSKTRLRAKVGGEVLAELSARDGEEGKRSLLKRAMRGTRDAAQNWEAEHAELLLEAGFAQGNYSEFFFHEQENIREDFTEESKSLDGFRGVAQKRMSVKFRKT